MIYKGIDMLNYHLCKSAMGQISKSVPVTDTSLLRYPPFVVVRAELVDEEATAIESVEVSPSLSLPCWIEWIRFIDLVLSSRN